MVFNLARVVSLGILGVMVSLSTGVHATPMDQQHDLDPRTSGHLWAILADARQHYEDLIPEPQSSQTSCQFRSVFSTANVIEQPFLEAEMECSRGELSSILNFESDSLKRFGLNTYPKGLVIEGEKAYRLFLSMQKHYQPHHEPYFHRDEIKLVDGTSRMNHWLDYSLKEMMPVQNTGGQHKLMRRFECGFENIYPLNQEQNRVYRCYFTSSYEATDVSL